LLYKQLHYKAAHGDAAAEYALAEMHPLQKALPFKIRRVLPAFFLNDNLRRAASRLLHRRLPA
jgi:hypothetical protein